MDNLHSIQDFIHHHTFVGPEQIIDLFPSKHKFMENTDGAIIMLLLPRVIEETKTNTQLQQEQVAQFAHAKTLLNSYLLGEVYQQSYQYFEAALQNITMLENTTIQTPSKQHEQQTSQMDESTIPSQTFVLLLLLSTLMEKK